MHTFVGKCLTQLSVLAFLYILGSQGIKEAMLATAIYIAPFLLVVSAVCYACPIILPAFVRGLWRIMAGVYEYIATFGDYEDEEDEEEEEPPQPQETRSEVPRSRRHAGDAGGEAGRTNGRGQQPVRPVNRQPVSGTR